MSCLTGPVGADPSEWKGTTSMTNTKCGVAGIDSHKDTIHVAVISGIGEAIADKEFTTTASGYRRAVAWLIEHGPLQAVGRDRRNQQQRSRDHRCRCSRRYPGCRGEPDASGRTA